MLLFFSPLYIKCLVLDDMKGIRHVKILFQQFPDVCFCGFRAYSGVKLVGGKKVKTKVVAVEAAIVV